MAGKAGRSGGRRPGSGRKPGVPNKVTAEVKALAQKHGPAAIKEAVRIMREAESDQARIAAIKEILDRGYGKAAQVVDLNPSDTFSDMLARFLDAIDGQSRGLPGERTPDGACRLPH